MGQISIKDKSSTALLAELSNNISKLSIKYSNVTNNKIRSIIHEIKKRSLTDNQKIYLSKLIYKFAWI